MYKVTNIAASREGAWHHNIDGFSPESHTHQFEPWIGGFQIKLNESYDITEEHFNRCRSLLEELVKHRILSISKTASETPVVEEVAPVEKEAPNKFDLSEEAVIEEPEESKLFGFETAKGDAPKITHKKKGR